MISRGRSRLVGDAPWLHRAAHRLTASGLRGSPTLWSLVSRLQREPEIAHWSPDGELTLELHPHAPFQEAELAMYRGHYERAERRVIERLVKPGGLCVDVGASFGIYTLLLASLAGEGGHVICCEPSPVALTRLESAVASIPWVDLHPVAVGARSEEDTLVVAPGDSMHSSLREHRRPDGESLVVQVRRLADLVPPESEIEFLKVDVEGGEAGVVEGMDSLLADRRVASAMFEVEPRYGSVAWVHDLAAREGYSAHRLELAPSVLRWRPRLRPVLPSDSFAGSLFLIRDDRIHPNPA